MTNKNHRYIFEIVKNRLVFILQKKKGGGDMKGESFKICVDLPKEISDELSKLKGMLRIITNTEMIRFSLGLTLLVTQHISEGYEIIFRKGDEIKTVLMPFGLLVVKVK